MSVARQDGRSGFTLMELMVVLALIVIMASISIPVIQVMLDDARLQGATDMVRAKAAEARAHAMDSGKPWRVAFIPGTGMIQIAPEDSKEWDQTAQTLIAMPELYRDQLPKSVYLGANPGDILSAGATPAGGSAWHTIAVYTYDGSAREDSITYYGKYGTAPMAMELRALTGSVTMRTYTEVRAMQQ